MASQAAGSLAAAGMVAVLPASIGFAGTAAAVMAASLTAGIIGDFLYDYAKQNGAFDNAAEFGERVWDALNEAANNAIGTIDEALDVTANVVQDIYDAARQVIGEVAQILGDPGFYQDLMNKLDQGASRLGQFLNDTLDWLGDALSDFFNPGEDAPSSDDPVPPPGDPGNPSDPSNPGDPGSPQQPAPYIPISASMMGIAGSLISPLVLDLDGDGVELRGKTGSTAFFDLNADGFAEQTGWVRPDDGLLALDRNGNNKIDNTTELFGNATTDGFLVLNTLDSNGDNKIDASDEVFANLRVWRDANQDGTSQYWELRRLTDLGITSIDLAATGTNQVIDGNRISSVSSYTRADGTSRAIVDAWFANDQVNTQYAGTCEFNAEAFLMPLLRGYGSVPNLHIAMCRDSTLLAMVKNLTALTPQEAGQFDDQIAAIMYRWAGVDGIDPTSRGAYVDARHLTVLERYFNQPFFQTGVGPNPRWNAGAALEDTWNTVFTEVKARLLVQGPLAGLFPSATYSLKTDALGGIDVNAAIDAAAAKAPSAGTSDLVRFWSALVPIFDVLAKDASPGVPYQGHLLSAIQASGLNIALSDLQTLASRTLTGTSNADNLIGTKAAEFIVGGAGNDTLAGNSGNDLYFFSRGDGSDRITDSGGDTGDVIQFGTDIVQGDVAVSRAEDDLTLSINGTTDKITVLHQFLSNTYRINEVRFDDGSVWDYDDLFTRLLASTPGNDALYGDNIANSINGGAGNDYLEGRGSNDTLDGGVGNDTLDGGPGANVYLFGRGSGQDLIREYDTDGPISTLRFAADVAPGDVTVSRTKYHLVLGIAGTSDRVTLENYFYNNGFRVERIAFADGTVWGYNDLFNRLLLAGTPGNDTLYGDGGANVINGEAGNDYIEAWGDDDIVDGGAGNDTLDGGTGANVYLFGRGSGQDLIREFDTDGPLSILRFAADVAPGDITVSRTKYHLVLGIAGTSDKVTLENYFYSGAYRVERIAFADGTVWGYNDLFTRLLAGTPGNDTLYGDGGANVINGEAGNDCIEGWNGNDTLDGGVGNDTLDGDAGANVYLFGRGSGQDLIREFDTDVSQLSTLRFAADVAPEDVTVARTNNYHVVLGIAGTSDRVTLENYFYSGAYRVERIAFADGTVWDYDTVRLRTMIGTSGNDNIVGFSGDDRLDGWGGNDTLDGAAGNDTLDGGGGNDRLIGGTGSDTYLQYRGGGQDIISNAASDAATTTDRVVFGSDVAVNHLWLVQVGSDLKLSIIGSTDQVTIAGWYSSANNQVDAFEAGDGRVMTANRVQQLVTAMAQFSPPGGTDSCMAPEVEQTLAPTLADSWRPAA